MTSLTSIFKVKVNIFTQKTPAALLFQSNGFSKGKIWLHDKIWKPHG